jgi:multidrug transporter EmrE-like cation transporter
MTAYSFILATFSVTLNALAQITLRKAMLSLGTVPPPITEPIAFALAFLRNFFLWGGFACYAVSIVLWLAVLSSNQVSVAYPMIAVGYVIVTALSFLVLGETIPPARLFGIVMICVGVLLVLRAA